MTKRNAFDRLKQEETDIQLPPAVSKAKRDRSWEREHNKAAVTYRNIPEDLRKAIRQIAEQLGVPVDDVARAFLEHSLQAYESGELQLAPQLESARLRLYPRQSAEK